MEAAKEELVNILKTMHLSSFNDGSEIVCDEMENAEIEDDLDEVVEDAYNNFVSNVKMTMANLEFLQKKYEIKSYTRLGKDLRFLKTAFRCLIKWCIDKKLDAGGRTSWMMNKDLISCLKKIEYPFSYLAVVFGDYAELPPEEGLASGIEDHYRYAYEVMFWLVEHVGEAYLDVTQSSPSNYFMSGESVVEFVDQVLENFRHLMEGQTDNLFLEDEEIIENLTQDLGFLKNLVVSSKERILNEEDLLIHLEAVGDMAAYVSYFYWIKQHDSGTFSNLTKRPSLGWIALYAERTGPHSPYGPFVLHDTVLRKVLASVKSPIWELYTRIHKALIFLLDFPLSDEILVGFLGLFVHSLTEMLEHNEGSYDVKHSLRGLRDWLKYLKDFLVEPATKHFVEPESLHILKLEINSLAMKIKCEMLYIEGHWDGFNFSGNAYRLREKAERLKETPLSHKLVMGFLDFLHRNLIELRNDDYHVKIRVKDELEILDQELDFLKHFLMTQPKCYAESENSCDLRIEIDAVARKSESIVYKIKTGGIAEVILSCMLSDLLKNIRLMKASAIQLGDRPLTNEHMLELMDCLHHNLLEVLKDKGPLKDQFEMLDQNLSFLRRFLVVKLPDCHADQEQVQSLRTQVEDVTRKVGSVVYLYFKGEKRNEIMPSHRLSELRREIMLIKALIIQLEETPLSHELLVSFLDALHHSVTYLLEDDIAGQVKDEFGLLNEDLSFLIRFLIDYPPDSYPPEQYDYAKKGKLIDIKLEIEAVGRKIASVVNPFLTGENMEMEMDLQLLRNENAKAEVLEAIFLIDLHRIRKKSPETDLLGFSNFLLDNLNELVRCKTDMDISVKNEIQRIHGGLEFLRTFLQYLSDNQNADDESKDVGKRISYALYEAEYLINSLLVGACPLRFSSLWISGYANQIKLTKEAAADIMGKKVEHKGEILVNKDQIQRPSEALFPTTDLVVGLEEEMDLIKQRLASDLKELDIVSVVGMGGVGKTTIAKRVYEDPFIVDHFYVRAWCFVSRRYKKRELMLSILNSVCEVTDEVLQMSDEDLAVKLHKELMGRRYLIVLDDIWGLDAWEELKRLFSDNNTGSRIMLTSRIKLDGIRYHLELRLLNDDESLNLLQKKVFLGEECPWYLCETVKDISRKCKGLPLAIVLVAGLLAKSPEQRYIWYGIERDLSLHIGGDSQRHWKNILELSYKQLPDYLKPLFLYMGVFPEDREIPAKKLIQLWIAEGFVHKNKLENLEDQAELNLKDLIDRSLVMPVKRGSSGRLKTCRMHDLLRDLCLAKAEEEHFFRRIHVCDKRVIYDQRRVSICPRGEFDYKPALESSVAPPLHSLLFFNPEQGLKQWGEAIRSIVSNSQLLSVLHSESIMCGEDSCSDLLKLIHLRYVSVRVSWNFIPSSISALWNLKTSTVKGSRGEIVVPDEVWNMVKLRHLHIDERASFGTNDNRSSKLENLESLSTPSLYYGQEKKLLERAPNLKRLRCIFFGELDLFTPCNWLPKLDLLNQLESLKEFYYGTFGHPFVFNLPSSLKKLTLTKFRLQWKEVSKFHELPNLEVLKLLFGAVDDEEWDMGDVEFPKLKYLKLESLNIKQWDASTDNFPCLEKLILERCRRLEEIPSGLGDICSLERIEVLWCSRSAAESAKQIEQEQEDFGNPLLKVHIYDPGLDSKSSHEGK